MTQDEAKEKLMDNEEVRDFFQKKEAEFSLQLKKKKQRIRSCQKFTTIMLRNHNNL
jgi:hypothetical protein